MEGFIRKRSRRAKIAVAVAQSRLAKAEYYPDLSSVAFAGPTLPSLVSYRSVIVAELFCNPGEDRGMDFGCFPTPLALLYLNCLGI